MKTRSSTIETPRSHFSACTLLLTLASSMANRPALCAVPSLIGRGRLTLNPAGAHPSTNRLPESERAGPRARPSLQIRSCCRVTSQGD